MKQEDKKLLLRDLCARLPYGVIIKHKDEHGRSIDARLVGYNGDWFNYYIDDLCFHLKIQEFKPYLRPLSSMTEEEIKELKTLCSIYIPTNSPTIGFEDYGIIVFTHHLTNNTYSFKLNISIIDWLNKKMFAYRTIDGKDMFELGLALEAKEGMYNLKEK